MWEQEIIDRLQKLERMLQNVLRDGTIAEVQFSPPQCRVRSGKLLTQWLPWYCVRAGAVRVWSPPTVGEQCTVVSPGGDLSAGKVLVGLSSDAFLLPEGSQKDTIIQFEDGSQLRHSSENHKLTATCDLDVIGEIHSTGPISSDTEVSAGEIALTQHRHIGPPAGQPVA